MLCLWLIVFFFSLSVYHKFQIQLTEFAPRSSSSSSSSSFGKFDKDPVQCLTKCTWTLYNNKKSHVCVAQSYVKRINIYKTL